MENNQGFETRALQPVNNQNSGLVFVQNEEVVTDSLTVASVFEKRHDLVLRDIRSLDCSENFRLRNFEESEYFNSQNKKQPKILIKRDGLAFLVMGYTGKKAAEYKEKYIEAFNAMEIALKNSAPQSSNNMSTEQLTSMLTVRLGEDVGKLTQKVETVESRMNDFELNAPILPQQAESLTALINKKVYSTINANYSGNKSVSSKLFARIGRDIKKAFGVNKRAMIAKKDFDRAVDFVQAWEPDSVTRYQLKLDLTDEAITKQHGLH